jgi:hypothetical protein
VFSSRDQPFEQKKIEKKDLSKKWMGLHGFSHIHVLSIEWHVNKKFL